MDVAILKSKFEKKLPRPIGLDSGMAHVTGSSMAISAQDREVLRSLASKVAEVATDSRQQETISLWKALNGLKPVRGLRKILKKI